MTRIITIVAALFLLANPATARHDKGGEVESMRRVAFELERAAGELHRRAFERNRHGDHGQRAALRALHDLERQAERFAERIDRSKDRPKKLRKEYGKLERSFRHAEHCLAELRLGRRGHREFAQVSRLFYRLGQRVDQVLIARSDRRRDRHASRDRYEDRYQDRYEVAFWGPWYWWARQLR